MQAPPVQFARSADGAMIAYCVTGSGPPLVHLPNGWMSHITFEWTMTERGEYLRRLADEYTLIRYDPRGIGESSRDVTPDPRMGVEDLLAVLTAARPGPVALFGYLGGWADAVRFAAAHSDMVSKLVLWPLQIELNPTEIRTLQSMMASDWRMFSEFWSHAGMGWEQGKAANELAALVRETITPERLIEYSERAGRGDWASWEHGMRDVATSVHTPTLVLAGDDERMQGPLRELVASMPHARMRRVRGVGTAPYVGDVEAFLSALREFTKEPGATVPPARQEAGGLRTILFTDLEGHAQMMARLGDAEGRRVLREHERITREQLREYGGSEIKTMGDGFLASFSSARRALECAVALERELATLPVKVRVGVNAGEPIEEEDDLFGASVIIAARVASKATGGQIFVADVVRQLVSGKGFLFSDTGEHALKGFEEPMRIWELRWGAGSHAED